MTMWVWKEGYENELLCDTCIHNNPATQCCEAEDCFGGDHYDNQISLLEKESDE